MFVDIDYRDHTPEGALAEIEESHSEMKDGLIKSVTIFQCIADWLNSTKGEEYEFWSETMDRYNEKYKT